MNPPLDRPPAPAAPDPWVRAGAWIAAAVWVVLLATILVDRMAEPYRPAIAWAGIALLVLIDIPGPRGRRGEGLPARLAITVAGTGLTLAIGFGIGALVDRTPQALSEWYLVARREMVKDFWPTATPWLLVATGWFAAPFVQDAWRARRDPAAASVDPVTRRHALLLLAWVLWIAVTLFASIRPDRSYARFATEMGIHAPFLLFWLRAATARPALQSTVCRIAPWMMAAAVAAGLVVAAFYLTGDWNRQVAMGNAEILRTEFVERQYIHGWQWRLNFPLGHHNRMGYFSMLAALLLVMAARASRGWLRGLSAAAAVGAVATLGFTLNRGSYLALAAGLGAMGILWLGRRSAWLLLLVPVAWFAMTDLQRDQVLSLVRPETYSDRTSTIVTRMDHWRMAARLIRENPVFGIGYGWRHFEQYTEDYAERIGEPVYEKAHAHNLWLQTGAETGFPGLLLYAAWTLSRWSLLYSLIRRRRALPARDRALLEGWCGVEAAIQVFCLGNLPLRLGLGLFTWGLWAVMWIDLIRLSRSGLGSRPSPA